MFCECFISGICKVSVRLGLAAQICPFNGGRAAKVPTQRKKLEFLACFSQMFDRREAHSNQGILKVSPKTVHPRSPNTKAKLATDNT